MKARVDSAAFERHFFRRRRRHLSIAEELKGNVIDLEGHELVAVELGHADTDYRPLCTSLLSASSWLATLFTMTSTSTSLNQMRRHDGSGSTRWGEGWGIAKAGTSTSSSDTKPICSRTARSRRCSSTRFAGPRPRKRSPRRPLIAVTPTSVDPRRVLSDLREC